MSQSARSGCMLSRMRAGGRSTALIDRRLLRHAAAARPYLVITVALGLGGTGLILAQAGLLARALAGAARGDAAAALAATLAALLVVVEIGRAHV